MAQQTPVEWLESRMKNYAIDLDILADVEQAKELHKADAMRSYRAGMMQGFRMLQSYMTFEQQARFGFHDKDGGKINALLDKEADVWWIELTKEDWFCPKCDSYVSAESVTYEETHQICNTGVIIKETKHMTQTAVEILVENLKMILPISQFNDVLVQDVIKQANKIMEQQISKAYKDGQRNGYNYYDGFDPLIDVKDYYNQTYGKETDPR